MKHSPYSPSIDDDYFPNKDAARKPALWKGLLVIGFCLFFIYRSTLPVMHLQSKPPAEFINPNSNGSHQPTQQQRRIAQAYWKVTVQSIQPEYTVGKPLPATPPPEFTISTNSADLAGGLHFERAYYWQRLRDVWQQPEAWRVSYGWNTEWLDHFMVSVQQHLRGVLRQFVQNVGFWRDKLGNTTLP